MAIKYRFLDANLIYDDLFCGATPEELREEFEKTLATQVACYKKAKQRQIENARNSFLARFLDYASALDVDISKEDYEGLEARFQKIEAEVSTSKKTADMINDIVSKTKAKNNKVYNKNSDDEILKMFFESL